MALILDTNDTYHKGGYIKKRQHKNYDTSSL